MATLIVGAAVSAVIFLAVRQLYRDKKNGKSSCGGNCAGCPNSCAYGTSQSNKCSEKRIP